MLQGVNHRCTSFPFHCFQRIQRHVFVDSSELIALEFTAFKARAQLIIWPTETPTAASEHLDFLLTHKQHCIQHAAAGARDTVLYHVLVSISYLSFPFTPPLHSFHPLRWCTVSRSQHPLSSKRSMSKAVIDFFLCVCVFFLYKDDIKVKHHLCN